MTAQPDTALQVNFKLPDQTLINVYAKDGNDLRALLSELQDAVTDIAETSKLLLAAGAVVPIIQPPNGGQDYQSAGAPPAWAQAPSGPPPQACPHGAMVYKEGISQKTGNPYKMWVCSANDPNCRPKFVR